MNDNDEFINNNESSLRKDNMFLPIHVETEEKSDPEVPRIKDTKPKAKTPTLSPVLLSPGSTTKKLIESGKIKHCVILLEKASLDPSYVQAFTDMRKDASSPGILPREDDSSPIQGDQVESTEATSLTDSDDGAEDTGSAESEGAVDHPVTSRNIFTSFYHEWPARKTECEADIDNSSDRESIPGSVGENASNQDTSLKDIVERSQSVWRSEIDDDAMSVSSTGSRETAVYPIHAREDTPEMYEIMTDDETMSTNTESDLDEEPPCLERLESLPAPGHCLDHPPVLSPRVLFGASDFYPLGETDPVSSQPELDSEAPEVCARAPDGSIDVPVRADEVMSAADNCEVHEDTLPEKPPGTEQLDPRQSSNSDAEVSVTCSTDRTEEQADKTADHIQQTSSTESEQDALKNVINDVFLSHLSPGTEEVFSNEENSPDNLQDLTNTTVTEKDHCVGNEYEDMLQQIADSNKRINSDDGDQEVLYSEAAPEEDSGVTEIVSLGEGISTIPQENISNDVPNVGVTQDQSHDITEQSSVTSLDKPDANVGSNNPSPDNASTPQSLETSPHNSLTRIDSQTELDKADRPRNPETNRTQDDQETVLDANIEVAEVVIDSHVYDPHSRPDSVGVMFPLDLRTCIDNENHPDQDPDQNAEKDKQTHSEQTEAECTLINKIIDTHSASSMEEVAPHRDEKSHNTNDSGGNETPNPNCSIVPDVSSRSGLLSMNSGERTKAPRPDAERKLREGTSALPNSPNVHGSQNGEEESLVPQTASRASSGSNECTVIRDSVRETESRTNQPVQNPPTSQDMATFSADRPQDGSNTGENIAKGFGQTLRRSLKTQELDIALSLAFMSEITSSNKPRTTAACGYVTSASRQTPSVPVSQLDKHHRGDARIRHQSAPKASVGNRQEDNPESNAKRPHSTHGPTTQAVVAPGNFQQARAQCDRGVAQNRNSGELNFPAVSSNSPPMQSGQCNELIWHLTQAPSQKQNPLERGHPGSTPQQTKMPHVTHLKATALQHEPSIPPKQLQAKDSRRIPIQLTIDKRFLPSSIDVIDNPHVGVNSKRGNGHSGAPIENRFVIPPNHTAGFVGPGVTFPQQLAKNAIPIYKIVQPTSMTSVKSHSTNHQERRAQDIRSPQTTESTVSGVYPANQQQRLLVTTPHQTPCFVPVLNARPLSPKRVVYVPDQPHTVRGTNQAPVRPTSNNIPGVAVTQPTIIFMQPTNNVATIVSKAPVVLQAERPYNKSVNPRAPQNPNVTFLPNTDNSKEINPTRQKETADSGQGNAYRWNPQQDQQKLFASSGSFATIPNAQRSLAGTPTTNFSQLETLRPYAARNNEYHHSQTSLQPAVSTTPSVEAVYKLQNENVLKGRNFGPLTRAQPAEQSKMAQTMTQPTLMTLSASAYIGDLAKATRSRAANAASPSAQATFHPQVIQPPTSRYQTVFDIDSNTSNRERGNTDEEWPPRSDSAMDDPKHKTSSYPVPTSLESDVTYATHDDVRLTKPASTPPSQDKLQTTEPWTQSEKALLKSLPEQLSNYLVKQRRTLGVRVEESLKAVLTSLLSEEEGETGKPRREATRVWHSTIHHLPADATSLSYKETGPSARELTHPTDVPHQTLSEPHLTSRSTPPVQNATQNQGSDRGHSEASKQDSDAHQRQLDRPPAISKLRFYNPAPSLTPLMDPDVVSDRVDNRMQGETDNSQGNTDSVLDLTIKTPKKAPQMAHHGIAATEHNALFSNYTPAIGYLYPRAYSAGQAGPIMPSSYVPTSPAPLKRHNLTSAQFLIRNKLLERRHRIQSRSISTPDIVHVCEYPNSRKRKGDIIEPAIQPAKVPSPGNPLGSSRTEYETIYYPVAAPSPTVEAVSSADDAATHHKEAPSENIRDPTSIDSREVVVREASSLTQYPKMKSSLQNRWVTESFQPSTNDNKEQNPPRRDFLSGVNGIRAEQRITQDQPSNTTTAISPGIQISNPVELVTSTASVPSAVKTTSILVQVVEKKAPGKVSRAGSRPEKAKESKGPTKDQVRDVLVSSTVSCQFCSFRSYSLSDVRLHIKREHFSKYEKKNVSTRKHTKRFDAGRSIANPHAAQVREVMSDATTTVNVHTKGTFEPPVDKGSASNGATCIPAPLAGFVSPHHEVRSQGHPGPDSNTGLPVQPGTTAALLHAANGIHQAVNAAPTTVTSQLSPSIMTSKHMSHLTELTDEQLSCSQCEFQFTNAKDLHFHVKLQHTDTKGLHMCFNCGYTAKTKYGLRKHILRWHTQEKQANSVYKCPHKKCDQSFENIHELHRHSMTHDAKSKYECDMCGAKYRNINGLRYHKIRHNLNYPHKCKQCGLNFKTMGVLHRHEVQTKHVAS